MSSRSHPYPSPPTQDAAICSCGHSFVPSAEQRLYCSRNCAVDDGLRALQGLDTQYRRRARQRMEQMAQRDDVGKPRSRFSKPLPRVLTVWLNAESVATMPPTPPPKSARHLPKSFEQQQTEALAAGLRPRPASLDLTLNAEVAPTPPLKSPRHLRRKKTPPPRRIAKDGPSFVVAADAPPVPRLPSHYITPNDCGSDASSKAIRTYIPPRSFRSYGRDVVDSIPQDFYQLEAARASQLVCRTYVPPPRKTLSTRLYDHDQDSPEAPVTQASTTSVSSVSQVHQDQPYPSHRRPGRRPHATSRVVGEDIPIVVPDGYMSDPTDIDSSSRATYLDSRSAHRLRELPETSRQSPRSDGRKSDRSTNPGPTTDSPSASDRSLTFLDVRFPFDGDGPSDLWRAVQTLRLDQDDQDYRQRLVDRPTIYEDKDF
ncbi:hypothetical protein PHLGIDRAFT_372468 [Phlebiopsis gigantea 11061_1 CR5-6]|uniref:Uncharacterized protein n=1 Tax=Phlebiopsis gigantea (strain 11061_1 CR5-6) TaxID=745531 RepID=A0A0C3NTK1_PHLG1|nr:hypothetical protein PHLGIDRAFT_372468 [Phlebiopsis gigantea 11061_1 CR5-6]